MSNRRPVPTPPPTADTSPDVSGEPVVPVAPETVPEPPVDSPDNKPDGEGVPVVDLTRYVKLEYPVAARGQIATRLLESADRLGIDRQFVRTVSKGFKVPEAIARDLFPSRFAESE